MCGMELEGKYGSLYRKSKTKSLRTFEGNKIYQLFMLSRTLTQNCLGSSTTSMPKGQFLEVREGQIELFKRG